MFFVLNEETASIKLKKKVLLLLIFNRNNLCNNYIDQYNDKQEALLKKFRIFLRKKYSKVLKLNYSVGLNKKPLFNKRSIRLIRTLKYQKTKKDYFKDRCLKHH